MSLIHGLGAVYILRCEECFPMHINVLEELQEGDLMSLNVLRSVERT